MPRPGLEKKWLRLADRILEKEIMDEKQTKQPTSPAMHSGWAESVRQLGTLSEMTN